MYCSFSFCCGDSNRYLTVFPIKHMLNLKLSKILPGTWFRICSYSLIKFVFWLYTKNPERWFKGNTSEKMHQRKIKVACKKKITHYSTTSLLNCPKRNIPVWRNVPIYIALQLFLSLYYSISWCMMLIWECSARQRAQSRHIPQRHFIDLDVEQDMRRLTALCYWQELSSDRLRF